jgi:hypothetical protein
MFWHFADPAKRSITPVNVCFAYISFGPETPFLGLANETPALQRPDGFCMLRYKKSRLRRSTGLAVQARLRRLRRRFRQPCAPLELSPCRKFTASISRFCFGPPSALSFSFRCCARRTDIAVNETEAAIHGHYCRDVMASSIIHGAVAIVDVYLSISTVR